MEEIVIFGAGTWGELAYYYYRNRCDIKYYIDNDSNKWNTYLNGIKVVSPDILHKYRYKVIVANRLYEKVIRKQLFDNYKIAKVINFHVEVEYQEFFEEENDGEEELIISFKGGLGNQMFQYALYRNYINLGKNVRVDDLFYISTGVMPFELTDVFQNINLKRCSPQQRYFYLNEEVEKLYEETEILNDLKISYNKDILQKSSGYIKGYHQTYLYAENVKKDLIHDFKFDYKKEKKLEEMKRFFDSTPFIAIHIRRGDYLKKENEKIFGQICTLSYYKKAINYVKEKLPEARFCFFSDDIPWVKKIFKEENSIYMCKELFDNYQNWYDMFLMSICKHNIIANSTFSWWGAWLNQYPEKIVIAPKKWINADAMFDICPPDWIRI